MRFREITQLTEADTPAQKAAQRAGLGRPRSIPKPSREHVKALVLAQLPKYAKKSIPIFGWAYMLYDLYVRVVLEKDYKGAMMSLAVDGATIAAQAGGTVIGGPVAGAVSGITTQFAGIAGLVARDTYGQHFCLDPKTQQPIACIPGNHNNIPLQWEDDNLDGYKDRREEWLKMVTDALNVIADDIMSMLPKGSDRITGQQGAANARDALRNYSTAGNPSPYLHPDRYPK